jgi:DNA repair and recombination protein RAD52
VFNPEQKAALEAKLDPTRISQRTQAGRSLDYIEGWFAISEANRIFGHSEWDRETVVLDQVRPAEIVKDKYNKDQWRVGYMAKVRITVRANGAFATREGTGFGSGAMGDLGDAIESAIKEAETDAMKRALMTFGNPFGLALYDKTRANVGPEEQPEPAQPASKAPSRDGYTRLEQSMRANRTADDLVRWWKDPESVAERAKLPDDWQRTMFDSYRTLGAELRKKETKADNSAVQNMMAG